MQLNTVPTGSVGADGYRCRSLRFVIGFAGRRTRALLFFVGGTSTTAEVILILISILTCESPTNTVTLVYLAMGDHVTVTGMSLASPLDTLARRTSSRRRPNAIQIPSSQTVSGEDSQQPHVLTLDTPSMGPLSHLPQSPLLHTRFRASVATQSTFNTSSEVNGYTHARMASETQDIPYDDDVSIYSNATSLPISRHMSNTVPVELERVSDLHGEPRPRVTSGVYDDHRSINGSMHTSAYQRSPSGNSVPIPTVVVSVEEPGEAAVNYDQERGNLLPSPAPGSQSSVGRVPSALPKYLNFSRPVRPGGASDDSKRQVLARNAFRQSAFTRSSPQLPTGPSPRTSPHLSPLQEKRRASETPLSSSMSSTSSLVSSSIHPPNPRIVTNNQIVPLLHDPPRASSSPSSLYSAYSYYQLDSPSDSPTSDFLQVPASPHTPPPRSLSPLASPALMSNPQQPELADQFLQEGIRHHEANQLREAAIAFERSATTPGGSGVGMLMWGLTLRHGWGCPKNETLGFSWLRRAAEAAVGDLESARAGLDTSAVRGELVLAIYEVGQCFFQGWGVKKDQKMAVVSLPFRFN
ncbi:hypothetical protein BC827DRAFT_115113 [Russula dissimulans]|nr:hypothetical protein BC827DRAFT_115113 [Russula dissimulans]